MSLLTEEQKKKLNEVNIRFPNVNESCIGCSVCTTLSDEVFELNDEGMSQVKACDIYEDKMVDDAISACPVNAISWNK